MNTTSEFIPDSCGMMSISEVFLLLLSLDSIMKLTRVGEPGIVQSLQDLHDMLQEYHAPEVVHPRAESRKRFSRWSLGSLFGASALTKSATAVPPNVPKGLYMYGDVGSGKILCRMYIGDCMR